MLTTALRDGTLLYVLRTTGTTAENLRTAGETVAAVDSLRVTEAGDPLRYELVVSRPAPESILADRGARVVEVTVTEGTASMTVASRTEGDVRSLVEAVRAEYPGADVRSVRSDDERAPGASVATELTDKQQQAVEVALYSGYFRRPREHNTTEIATKLGISRQTFTQHLRAGQEKLLSAVFDSQHDDRS